MATLGKNRRRSAWAAVGALTIGLVLAGPAAQVPGGPARPAVASGDGAHCPDKAPLGGRHLYSYAHEGHHVDAYLAPFHDGWQTVEVICD